MRRIWLALALSALMIGSTGTVAVAQTRSPDVTGCDLRPVKPTGGNSVITASAHISCFGPTARLYIYVCVFKGPDRNFSNARDIGCSDNVYYKMGGGGNKTWFTWTCGPCDHLGPHHETVFNQGKGYYWSWAQGLCPSCTPAYKAGPSLCPCYYGGSTCT